MEYTPKQKEFISKAEANISEDPISRLSEITKATLLRNNFVFDAHSHVFDGKCINVGYLAIRMISGVPETIKAWVWRLITGKPLSIEKSELTTEELAEELYNNKYTISEIDNYDAFLTRMEKSLDELEQEVLLDPLTDKEEFSFKEFLIRYRNIIKLLYSKNMDHVYNFFHDNYAIHNVINKLDGMNKEFITIVLGMDLNSGWEGRIKKTYSEQNQELSDLSKSYPMIPFFPIDPRRADYSGNENLYDLFLTAFDKDSPLFFGVKCYPSLGYLPSDSRLKPIFEVCAKKNIPVLTHCGGEIISTFQNPIKVNRDGVEEYVTKPTRIKRARFLNEPLEWLPVLETHANLKLCLGHFGSGLAWKDTGSEPAQRIPLILDMMKKFQVFTDFSFNLESDLATDNFIAKLEQTDEFSKLMKIRTMFGTDFWVILPLSNLNSDQEKFIKKIDALNLRDDLLKNNVISYLGLGNLH